MKNRATNIAFAALAVLLLIGVLQFDLPGWTIIAAVLAYIGLQVYGSFVLSAEWFLPVRWRGDSGSGAVALTFDDGPVVEKTERLLQILRQHNVRAAFFCIGKRVAENPSILKKLHEEGHLIGNHSYFHGRTFDLQSASKISGELSRTNEAIRKQIGLSPRFFRPPYGVTNPMVASAVKKENFITIGWSVRSFDTVTKNKEQLFRRVTRQIGSGSVIVFHDFCDVTIEILPSILDYIKNKNLQVVRIDELLNEKAYA